MGKFNMQEPVYEVHGEGVFVGELCEFHDEGYKEGKFGTYRSAYFEISTGELNADGEVFFPMRYYVNENAGERSKTTLFREAVEGRKLSRAERVDFDPEELLGMSVQVQVKQVQRDGKTYAQIENVMAMPKQQRPQQQQQAQQQRPAAPAQQQQQAPPADDGEGDLPF